VVSLGRKTRHIEFHYILRAGAKTQLATFTVCIAYFDPAFDCHSRSFGFEEKFDIKWRNTPPISLCLFRPGAGSAKRHIGGCKSSYV
jgi:hypothetical protein